MASSRTDAVAKVDLSNSQVVYCLFSEQRMKKMSKYMQIVIRKAVEKSDFKSMQKFRSQLRTVIQEFALEEKHLAMLDLGSSSWVEIEGVEGMRQSEFQDEEITVRNHFRTVTGAKGLDNLSISKATEALNGVLHILGLRKLVNITEFEQAFLKVTGDLEVSEDTFVKVFCEICDSGQFLNEAKLAKEYATFFDNANKDRSSTSVAYATRTFVTHAMI